MEPRPNTERIASILRQDMRNLMSDGALPSVRALMKRFGVSQSIIAQAMLILKQEGLIETQGGRRTIVTEKARLRPVLWVCGVDIFHGEISPAYSRTLQYSKALCAQHGLSLDAAWISNIRPEDAVPYCRPGVLDHHAGFLFCGCGRNHPLLRYVSRSDVPFVAMTHYGSRSAYRVVMDLPHMLETGLAYLKSKGHHRVTLMTGNSPWQQSIAQEVAAAVGVEVQLWLNPEYRWTVECQREGYRRLREEIASNGLPSALFITDDIVARGATRAILEACSREEIARMDLVVASARQCMAPLGLSAAYLMLDIEEVVRRAVDLLLKQQTGLVAEGDEIVKMKCSLVTDLADMPQEPDEGPWVAAAPSP